MPRDDALLNKKHLGVGQSRLWVVLWGKECVPFNIETPACAYLVKHSRPAFHTL